MSEKNRDRSRAARDRLVQQREQDRARERRRRTLIVATAVVGVLALAAVIGVIAANAGKNDKDSEAGPAVTPSGAMGEDGLALQVGADDAPSTLTIWEDFRCPVCAQFENAFRDTFTELADSGQLKVEYHLATIIDGNLGGSGSSARPTRPPAPRTSASSPRTTTSSTATSPPRPTTPSATTAS